MNGLAGMVVRPVKANRERSIDQTTATFIWPPGTRDACIGWLIDHGAPGRASGPKEEPMNTKRIILAGCASLILSAGTALAGPCDTSDRAANLKDAGSGPASTGSGQTTGMASDSGQHPPTGTMNRKTDDVAASSQDAQKQMQGQPTAAQEAQGAKPDAKTADKDC
jgi:hypothetical protein